MTDYSVISERLKQKHSVACNTPSPAHIGTLEFWVKWPHDFEGHGQCLPFSIRAKISQDACLVHICWFQLKSGTSYRADKAKLHGRTDRGTDGWVDGHRQPQYPFGLNVPGVKIVKKTQKTQSPICINFPKYAIFSKELKSTNPSSHSVISLRKTIRSVSSLL